MGDYETVSRGLSTNSLRTDETGGTRQAARLGHGIGEKGVK
jgi:hypothetical protein